MSDRYTWIGFYSEFADALLEFKDRRQELLERIMTTYQRIGIKLPTLEHGELPDGIDPFTVFGLFNKGITEDNRKLIISGLCRVSSWRLTCTNSILKRLLPMVASAPYMRCACP